MEAIPNLEDVVGLLFIGLCAFFVFKAFAASSRMRGPKERMHEDIYLKKKYQYLFELLWPFSLFRSKDKNIKQRRHHLVDMLFYVSLLFFTMMAFALVMALLE